MQGPELVLISKEKSHHLRLQGIVEEFQYSAKILATVEQLVLDSVVYHQTALIVLVVFTNETNLDLIKRIRSTRQTAPRAHISLIIQSKMSSEEVSQIKDAGTNSIIMEEEFLHTSKAEFIFNQVLRTKYLHVKADDIQEGAKAECTVYHLMPLNNKYIPIVLAGQVLTKEKKEKLKSIKELYILKEETGSYEKYVESVKDSSKESVERSYRAQFLSMCTTFTDLILLLSDQGEHASFQDGKALYEKCLEMAKTLLSELSTMADPWNIINEASIGKYGTADRAPAVAAYAGLLSLQTSIGTPEDCMIAAMMSDIGMLMLSPSINKKIRALEIASLNPEERLEYEKHPIYGLNQCLSRKVPIPEKIKHIILSVHERADGEGFPNRPIAEKIPDEAMIVQFCELIDNEATLRKEKPQKGPLNVLQVRLELFVREQTQGGRFSSNFIARLKPYLQPSQ